MKKVPHLQSHFSSYVDTAFVVVVLLRFFLIIIVTFVVNFVLASQPHLAPVTRWKERKGPDSYFAPKTSVNFVVGLERHSISVTSPVCFVIT